MARSWSWPRRAPEKSGSYRQGHAPEKTLGVTFTNRAAEHMRNAVAKSCGADSKDCRIHTFHDLQSGYAAKSGCGVSPQ